MDKSSDDKHDLAYQTSQLEDSYKMLCEKFSSVIDMVCLCKRENTRYRSILEDTLDGASDAEHPMEPIASVTCTHCASMKKELSAAVQEKENLDYMKPYTQELVTQNEILRTRVRSLESDLEKRDQQLRQITRKHELYYSSVDHMRSSVPIMQRQIQNIQQHLKLLSMKVKETQIKNVELETVNRHQNCMLVESYDVIKMLKSRINGSKPPQEAVSSLTSTDTLMKLSDA